jgi:hypothetical protein
MRPAIVLSGTRADARLSTVWLEHCRYRIPDVQNRVLSRFVTGMRRPRAPLQCCPPAAPSESTPGGVVRGPATAVRASFDVDETDRMSAEICFLRMKPVLARDEMRPKHFGMQGVLMIGKRSLTMSAIISLIYREYCRARLAEIQKIGG